MSPTTDAFGRVYSSILLVTRTEYVSTHNLKPYERLLFS